MDIAALLKAFSNEELNELREALIKEYSSRLDSNKLPPLSEQEQSLLTNNAYVKAILAYRDRTHQTIYVSKMVVEKFKNK